jgi:hypothetical protein
MLPPSIGFITTLAVFIEAEAKPFTVASASVREALLAAFTAVIYGP